MPNKETGVLKLKTDGGMQTTKDLIAAIKMALDDATRQGRRHGRIFWPNIGDNSPWPLGDCVSHLLVAVQHLFDGHDCDHVGHESWTSARSWADRYLRNCLEEIERLKLTGEMPPFPIPHPKIQPTPKPHELDDLYVPPNDPEATHPETSDGLPIGDRVARRFRNRAPYHLQGPDVMELVSEAVHEEMGALLPDRPDPPLPEPLPSLQEDARALAYLARAMGIRSNPEEEHVLPLEDRERLVQHADTVLDALKGKDRSSVISIQPGRLQEGDSLRHGDQVWYFTKTKPLPPAPGGFSGGGWIYGGICVRCQGKTLIHDSSDVDGPGYDPTRRIRIRYCLDCGRRGKAIPSDEGHGCPEQPKPKRRDLPGPDGLGYWLRQEISMEGFDQIDTGSNDWETEYFGFLRTTGEEGEEIALIPTGAKTEEDAMKATTAIAIADHIVKLWNDGRPPPKPEGFLLSVDALAVAHGIARVADHYEGEGHVGNSSVPVNLADLRTLRAMLPAEVGEKADLRPPLPEAGAVGGVHKAMREMKAAPIETSDDGQDYPKQKTPKKSDPPGTDQADIEWRSPEGADPVDDIKAAQEMIRSNAEGPADVPLPASVDHDVCVICGVTLKGSDGVTIRDDGWKEHSPSCNPGRIEPPISGPLDVPLPEEARLDVPMPRPAGKDIDPAELRRLHQERMAGKIIECPICRGWHVEPPCEEEGAEG